MKLELEITNNTSLSTNAQAVESYARQQIEKYRGCVATPETIKSDKEACATINKFKKAIADERIAFDKAVMAQPDVRVVHETLKRIEDLCDEVRVPYWESVKALTAKENENSIVEVSLSMKMPSAVWNKLQSWLNKNGITYKSKGAVHLS